LTEIEAVWDQRSNEGRLVGEGNYTMRGLLLAEDEPLETLPVPLRVEG
jgi:hypothetical protein